MQLFFLNYMEVSMKKIKCILFFFVTLFLSAYLQQAYALTYKMAGGPSGGVFILYSKAIAKLAKNDRLGLKSSSSKGSIDNIEKVETGRVNFGIAYSGHLYQAINGKLKNNSKKYENLIAVGYLYGAPAQFGLKSDSKITSVKQMKGLKISVGNKGSGAAATGELFFKEMGVWDKNDFVHYGYKQSIRDFIKDKLDGFWLFTGFQSPSVNKASEKKGLILIDTYLDAEPTGFFKTYPYFSKVVIPANTYKNVSKDTVTFEDSTILIVNKTIPEEIVYRITKVIFCDNGLKYLAKKHSSAKNLKKEDAIKGIVTPFHPGAIKYYKEIGVMK